ncbi:MAG: hypothetical protein M1826_007366 [Phylliscum demangeonii]|nr:MAG: hypothetical protein M1826_007366 [Phylliscum demangeonii]
MSDRSPRDLLPPLKNLPDLMREMEYQMSASRDRRGVVGSPPEGTVQETTVEDTSHVSVVGNTPEGAVQGATVDDSSNVRVVGNTPEGAVLETIVDDTSPVRVVVNTPEGAVVETTVDNVRAATPINNTAPQGQVLRSPFQERNASPALVTTSAEIVPTSAEIVPTMDPRWTTLNPIRSSFHNAPYYPYGQMMEPQVTVGPNTQAPTSQGPALPYSAMLEPSVNVGPPQVTLGPITQASTNQTMPLSYGQMMEPCVNLGPPQVNLGPITQASMNQTMPLSYTEMLEPHVNLGPPIQAPMIMAPIASAPPTTMRAPLGGEGMMPVTTTLAVLQMPISVLELGTNQQLPAPVASAAPIRVVNPYRTEVQLIGRYHGLQGIELLPEHLFDPPPPWREGDVPITPEEARGLYQREWQNLTMRDRQTHEEIMRLPADQRRVQLQRSQFMWRHLVRVIEMTLEVRLKVWEHYQRAQQEQQIYHSSVPHVMQPTPGMPSLFAADVMPPVNMYQAIYQAGLRAGQMGGGFASTGFPDGEIGNNNNNNTTGTTSRSLVPHFIDHNHHSRLAVPQPSSDGWLPVGPTTVPTRSSLLGGDALGWAMTDALDEYRTSGPPTRMPGTGPPTRMPGTGPPAAVTKRATAGTGARKRKSRAKSGGTPTAKEATRVKGGAWADEVARANLPPPAISQQAMEDGRRWREAQAASRGGDENDQPQLLPMVDRASFPISLAAARHLVGSGFVPLAAGSLFPEPTLDVSPEMAKAMAAMQSMGEARTTRRSTATGPALGPTTQSGPGAASGQSSGGGHPPCGGASDCNQTPTDEDALDEASDAPYEDDLEDTTYDPPTKSSSGDESEMEPRRSKRTRRH